MSIRPHTNQAISLETSGRSATMLWVCYLHNYPWLRTLL